MGYAYFNDGDGWRTEWGSVFGAKQALIAETEATSILCATVTESTEVERCEFELNDETFTLVMMEATYDIELRLASTANVIGRDTVSAAADACSQTRSQPGRLIVRGVVGAYFDLTPGFAAPTISLRNPGAAGDPFCAVWATAHSAS